MRQLLAAILIVIGLPSLVRLAADEDSAKVGDLVGRITFKDIRYLPHSLDEFRDRKAVVLVFTTTTCPLVQRYMPRIKRLESEYRDREVQFVAVNVGPDDTITDVAEQALRHGTEFPFVKDFDGSCARTLGVTRTPETVVLDQERRLRYRGRIDDQYRLGGIRERPSREELRDAIDAVLAGVAPPIAETPVDGCLITMPAPRPDSGNAVTYAKDIAPLIAKHCSGCHRSGTVAPFSLTSHRAIMARGDMIAEVVREERMPPWYGSRKHTEFVNRRAMSANERELLLNWIENGAPVGTETLESARPLDGDAPAPSWTIGEPDLIVTVPKPFDVPAEGVIPYQYVILPHSFAHDTWVQAVQIKPDNHRTVHHCNMAYISPTEGFKSPAFITGVVPGGDPLVLDHDVAFRIPKGSSLVLQIHYVPTGRPEVCQISVGFRFARDRVQKQLRHMRLEDTKFAIPPGAQAHEVTDTGTLECDAIGIGLFSHMHLRGRDMSFISHPPDEAAQELLVIPNYSFSWQHSYRWEYGAARFRKGTRIQCVAHYDNSAFNPYNPDSTVTVKEGPQTFHEMMNGFFFYVDADEQLDLAIDSKGEAKEDGGR